MLHKNKHQILIDKNKCINCMNCIRSCPVIFAVGISAEDEIKQQIDTKKCINCGNCIDVCPVKTIDYLDDTEAFFTGVNNETKMTLVCSDSIKNCFTNYKNLFGFLKQNGVDFIIKLDGNIPNGLTLGEDHLIDMPRFMNYSKKFIPSLKDYFPSKVTSLGFIVSCLKNIKQNAHSLIYLSDDMTLLNKLENPKECFDYFITPSKLNSYFNKCGIDISQYPEKDFDELDAENYFVLERELNSSCFEQGVMDSLWNIKVPIDRELQFLYKKLGKNTDSQKRINCNCCGYRTCENFAIAMYNNIAIEHNCIFYMKKQKEDERLKFEAANAQMQEINDKITDLLKDSMQVAQASERNTEKIKKILDNLIDVVIVTDADFLVQTTNMSFEKKLGYEEKEVINLPINIFFPSHASLFNQKGKGFKELSFVDSKTELTVMKKDGSCILCEVGMSQFENNNENSIVFIIRDISHHAEIAKMKDQFISTVSHELRTPLTSIKGSLGLLTGGIFGDFTPKVKELLAISESNCTRLHNLIDDILDLEKIKVGKMEFHYENVEIVNLINQAIYMNQPYVKQFGVTIQEFKYEDKFFVNVDKSRLLQVISNLISNAAKFSNAGGEIKVIVEKINTNIKVSVKDNGIGIAESARVKIFHSFSQVDSTDTRAKGGTGLGLNICKLLIEKMNGKIDFESKEGEGSTFFFILPDASQKITYNI